MHPSWQFWDVRVWGQGGLTTYFQLTGHDRCLSPASPFFSPSARPHPSLLVYKIPVGTRSLKTIDSFYPAVGLWVTSKGLLTLAFGAVKKAGLATVEHDPCKWLGLCCIILQLCVMNGVWCSGVGFTGLNQAIRRQQIKRIPLANVTHKVVFLVVASSTRWVSNVIVFL